MKYYLYIKSHCEAPDHEDECEASSKEEAIKIFLQRINQSNPDPWDEEMIKEYVASEKEIS